MKRRISLLICALVFAALSAACVAKNTVVRVPKEPSNLKKEGVFYALPRTVVSIEVPVIKIEEKKGKFERFAACFFPDETGKIIHRDKTAFDLGDPVISSGSEPDPDEVFMVKIKSHYFEDKNISMDWNERGVLTKGSTESVNHTVDIATQAAKTLTSLLGKAGAFGAAGATIDPGILAKIRDCHESVIKLANPNNVANITAALEDEFNEALNTYEKILSLQTTRENLLEPNPGGALPADTLQLALKELDDGIKFYKNMFFGTEKKDIWNARFAVTPRKSTWSGSGKDFQLFEFSADAGVCNTNTNPPDEVRFMDSGIKSGFICGATSKAGEKVKLNLTLNDGQIGTRIATAFNDKSESGERGFYYRIPITTTALVIKGEDRIFTTQLTVAQLGLTASLPASSGGRRTKYDVELYETGALKNFVLGSDALIQDSNVKGFGEAAETILDKRAEVRKAQAEAKKAEAQASDPLTQVKSVSDLLAECKKIKDAQEALGQPVSLPKQCTP